MVKEVTVVKAEKVVVVKVVVVKEVAAAAETAVVVTRYLSEGAFLGEKGSVGLEI